MTAKERKTEMNAFLDRFPEATSGQVVDHMSEKFADTSAAAHRGMYQRVMAARAKVKPVSRTPEVKPKKTKPEQQALSLDNVTTSRTPAKKTRKKQVYPFILAEDTQDRQQAVWDLYDPLKPPTERGLLRAVKKQFPEPAEPPTLAMIQQVLRVDGDLERYTENMEKLFGRAKCPTCDCVAEGVDDIYIHFGFREQNKRRQSYCRTCRGQKAKKGVSK